MKTNPDTAYSAERAALLRVVEGGVKSDQPETVQHTGATLERMGLITRSETRGWWLTEKGLRVRDPSSFAENPLGTGTTIALAGFALAAAWLLFKKKKVSPTPASCPIIEDKIDAWGKAKELYVMWLLTATTPPATWQQLKTDWLDRSFPEGTPTPQDTVVVTHPNATFWSYNYPDQSPQISPEAKASYCAF